MRFDGEDEEDAVLVERYEVSVSSTEALPSVCGVSSRSRGEGEGEGVWTFATISGGTAETFSVIPSRSSRTCEMSIPLARIAGSEILSSLAEDQGRSMKLDGNRAMRTEMGMGHGNGKLGLGTG